MTERIEEYDSEINDYEEHYLEHTEDEDAPPESLVGPAESFQEMRRWQFEFLKSEGLQPGDTVLDLGCGNFRAGIPVIDYLDIGNYTGLDISTRALQDGYKRLHKKSLGHKNPLVIQNRDLTFERVGRKHDYVLAQSVFTHLPPKRLKTCIENLGKVLKDDGEILFTYYLSLGGVTTDVKKNKTEWAYPEKHLKNLFDENSYTMFKVKRKHPNDLKVAKAV